MIEIRIGTKGLIFYREFYRSVFNLSEEAES
jgi:hypothetical protein